MIIVEVKIVDEDTGEVKSSTVEVEYSTYNGDVHKFFERISTRVERAVDGKAYYDE